MPELKRGRFVESPSKQRQSDNDRGNEDSGSKLGAGRGRVVKTEDVSEEKGDGGEGGVVMGARFQGLVNMVEEEKLKEGSNSSEGAQNLLDIEPPVSWEVLFFHVYRVFKSYFCKGV